MIKRVIQAGILLTVLAATLGFRWGLGHSQATSIYYPETGHFLSGEFREAHSQSPAKDLTLRAPITEVFTNPYTSQLVQFFQYGVLEQKGNQILRVPLGTLLPHLGQPANLPGERWGCKKFSGYNVCGAILDYYEKKVGGEDGLGQPVTAVLLEDGRYVQYFEYGRIEYFPDGDTGSGYARLTELGRVYFDTIGFDPARLLPFWSGEEPTGIDVPFLSNSQLMVHAFSEKSSVPVGEEIALFVIVRGKSLVAQPGRDLIASIKYPNQDEVIKLASPEQTNAYGFARIIIPTTLPVGTYGVIEVEIQVDPQQKGPTTRTSFRVTP